MAVTLPAQAEFFEPILGAASIPVAATAADPDGNVQRVTFLDNGRPLVADDAPPYTGALPVGAGQHVITAVARDDTNAETHSPPVFGYVPLASRAPYVVVTARPPTAR